MKKTVFSLFCILLISITLNAQKKSTMVLIKTSLGDIKVKLYDDTPMHKDNFLELVNKKYFDGVLFHRVIKGFMVQTGDPKSINAAKGAALGTGGPGYTVPAEISAKHFHKKGALSAARMGDQVNPMKESSGSQFYIVQGKKYSTQELDMIEKQTGFKFSPEQRTAYTTVGGAAHLDMGYTVFGEVIEGLDIIDKIAAQPTDSRDRPLTDIKIISTTVLK